MSTGTTNNSADLESVPIYQAPQAQAKFWYIPLNVLAVEAIFILICMATFGPLALIFAVPLHALLMLKTSTNQWWVKDLYIDFTKKMTVSNSGMRGERVVTFIPHTTRRELQQDRRKEKTLLAQERKAERKRAK